jgi:hypothetical protein
MNRSARATVIRIVTMGGLALAAGACNDNGVAPQVTKPGAELNFLRQDSTAPALANAVDSFWARRGSDRQLVIYYRPRPAQNDSAEFLRFRVDAGSLDKRPDGTPFAIGDSVLIIVRVIDPAKFIVDFQPSGLQFSPDRPAVLKFRFRDCQHDLNSDGRVDGEDDQLVAALSIWRQETDNDPWVKVGSVVERDIEEIEAELTGFTHYAIAF